MISPEGIKRGVQSPDQVADKKFKTFSSSSGHISIKKRKISEDESAESIPDLNVERDRVEYIELPNGLGTA